MSGRRPGVAPTENHRHRAVDPFVKPGDGWREIDDAPRDGQAPPIPAWVRVDPDTIRVYQDLAALPQAATWGAGDWLSLHLALPVIARYLDRPGAEAFKAITSVLGSALSLTTLDMQRARIKVRPQSEGDDANGGSGGNEAEAGPKVTSMASRRARLG